MSATFITLLEQVADPLSSLEQVDRRLDLDVCRKKQDPDLRRVRPNRTGRF
jgi:hypothetical protein